MIGQSNGYEPVNRQISKPGEEISRPGEALIFLRLKFLAIIAFSGILSMKKRKNLRIYVYGKFFGIFMRKNALLIH